MELPCLGTGLCTLLEVTGVTPKCLLWFESYTVCQRSCVDGLVANLWEKESKSLAFKGTPLSGSWLPQTERPLPHASAMIYCVIKSSSMGSCNHGLKWWAETNPSSFIPPVCGGGKMCMRARIQVPVPLHIHLETREDAGCSPLSLSTSMPWDTVFHWMRNLPFWLCCGTRGSWDLPVSATQCWSYRHEHPCPAFYMGGRDSNLGLHACPEAS